MDSIDQTIVVPEHIAFRQVAAEAVIVDLSSEKYFALDPVATRMWILLTTLGTIRAAYEQLVTEYDVDPAELRKDLEELVHTLYVRGLLTLR